MFRVKLNSHQQHHFFGLGVAGIQLRYNYTLQCQNQLKICNTTVDPYVLIPRKCVKYHRTQTIALSSTHFNSMRPFESLKPFSQSFALQPRRLGLSYKNKEINLEHVYWILKRIKPAYYGNIPLPNRTSRHHTTICPIQSYGF